jgi:hypothetical protein
MLPGLLPITEALSALVDSIICLAYLHYLFLLILVHVHTSIHFLF